MRSPVLALLAPAFAAFTLLTGAGATAPTQTAAMPTFKRQAPAPLGVRLQSAPAAEAGTLLDEVGRLSRRVEASEASNWKRELQGKRLKLERLARLHLWLGEYKLAHEQDPAGAYWHFRTINRMPGKSPELARLKGRAVLDIAIGRFKQGAYEEATHRFRKLLHPKTGLPGYDRREVALWHRHAAACYGYHARRAQAGITEPEEIDPECGAASLAVILRALGRPYDRKSVLSACRVTGFGSTLDDVEAAAKKLGLAFHDVILDEAGMKAIPKPVIVHVEHDHFVVLLRADEKGVTYGCSDCGSWPGGRREVSWNQWRLMEPGVVGAIYRRGSVADRAVAAVAGSRVQGSGFGVQEKGVQAFGRSGIQGEPAGASGITIKSTITITNASTRSGVRLAALPEAKGWDWDHIFDRHSDLGVVAKQSGKKTVFTGLTKDQIKARCQAAWKERELIQTQVGGDGVTRALYLGRDPKSKQLVEFWFNKATKVVETAYPVVR